MPVSVVVIFLSITLACFIHLSLCDSVKCLPSDFVSPNFENALNCSLNAALEAAGVGLAAGGVPFVPSLALPGSGVFGATASAVLVDSFGSSAISATSTLTLSTTSLPLA
uniref:Putative secreted protein n=1 Tax=Anopheles darlingi TaxID=43151 RepID=A0A2M4D7X7_ANODA